MKELQVMCDYATVKKFCKEKHIRQRLYLKHRDYILKSNIPVSLQLNDWFCYSPARHQNSDTYPQVTVTPFRKVFWTMD